MAKLLIKWVQVTLLTSSLMLGANCWSEDSSVSAPEQEKVAVKANDTIRPSFAAIMGDVFLVRPVTFGAMVVGSIIFVVALPVTAATGTTGEAGMTLVAEPAMSVFVRCLGCTAPGWRKLPRKDLEEGL